MSKYSNLIKLLILILAVVLIIIGFDAMRVKNIEVVGGEHYTADEITDKLLGVSDKFTGIIWIKDFFGIERNTIPFVEKVDLEIVDRNSIKLIVYDKSVSGCVEHMGKYMFFDRDGVVVESSDEKMNMVPIVTGVDFTSVVLSKRLEVENAAVFSKIMELTQLLKKYEIKAEEINFDIRNNVTIYVNGSIALMGESDNFDYRISGLKNVLTAAGNTKYKFDFRNYGPDKTDVSGIPINN